MGYERVRIQAASKLYETVMKRYMEAKMVEGTDKKIGWIASGAPVDLYHTLDIMPVYPENTVRSAAPSVFGPDGGIVTRCVYRNTWKSGCSRGMTEYSRCADVL